ncbi:MAG: hypothetical protein ACREEP_06890, partial [Dongiaceae bacterium]
LVGVATAPPPYALYGTTPGVAQPLPVAPGLAAGLAAPPTGAPSSVLTTLGPDGRPITPIKLKRPGSEPVPEPEAEFAAAPEPAEEASSDAQVAAVSPPAEPAELPDEVPMPEPTPPAPAPGVNANVAPAAPVVETPEPPAPEAPAAEAPAEEQPAKAEAPAEPAAEAAAAPAAEPPAEGEATEEAAAKAPAEPDNSQPAPPIPQGGIRIVFPADLNEVPSEANVALDDLATQMLADESMRIQIMCYAGGDADTESKARRKSLARCINIRQYLFKKDVRTTRMDVRALGLKSEGQPADRVDIVPASS